jgi:hypothetical protein
MKYNYLLGGITIATDIEYPQLVASPHVPEVELTYGDVPEYLENNLVDFPFVEANHTQYLLRLPNMARYLMNNGNQITIQPEAGAVLASVNNYVLTAVLGALSYMRGFMPFHGGAFLLNGKAVLISGISGIGKSALLAALHQQGYVILSDDISNVKIVDGKAFLYPSFPRIMLWKDTTHKLGLDKSRLHQMRGDMEKYFFQVDGAMYVSPVEVSALYVLTGTIGDNAVCNIKGRQKVDELRDSLFQPWMGDVFSAGKECYKNAMFLASLIKVNLFKSDRVADINLKADDFITTVLNNAE